MDEQIRMIPKATFASELMALIADLRARDLWIEPDLSFPFLVRWRAPLYVALGRLCERREEYTHIGRRTMAALNKLRSIGRLSHLSGWFVREF